MAKKMSDRELERICHFIDRLGATALGYGVSSFRLEAHLSRLALIFGLKSDFLVTPEKVVSILWQEGDERQRINISLPRHPGISLAGVAEIEELVEQIESGEVTVEEGILRLDALQVPPAPFGPLLTAVSFGLIAAGFAVLMSLPWFDVIIGGGLSMVTYAVVSLFSSSPRTSRLINPLAALAASLLAYLIAATLAPGSRYMMVTLCALIVLVPNPGLVLGVGELSSGHFISGATRLISAAVVLIELAFGAFLGTAIAEALWTIPAGSTVASMGPGWAWPAVAILGTGLAMLFQVRPKEIVWVVVGCLLAWVGIVVGGKLMGSGPGDLLGALTLGVFANVYALRRRLAASVILIPGLMVLAPGYASYLGLGTLQTSGVDAGLVAEFRVFVTIAWIIGGLFIANRLIPPKGAR